MSFNPPPNSPYRPAPMRSRSTQPWYRRTVYVVLSLIIFFPFGLVLLWLRHDWSVLRRGIITAVVGVVLIIVLPSVNSKPTTTTALSPTALGGTASPSHAAPASSKPASPSPVATKSRTPVTSAPPKTAVAAVPVQTSAAPAYTPPPVPAPTTQAPQPVQTTAQPQGCSPQTDSGKCYEPGEYCRDNDHGVTGVAGDGEAIKCEDNDGWRWEPV